MREREVSLGERVYLREISLEVLRERDMISEQRLGYKRRERYFEELKFYKLYA